jgi:hypothetical protein
MKIEITDTTIREVELELPYYSKRLCSYYQINTERECILVFNARRLEQIGWTNPEAALSDKCVPCTKEEFEAAFEDTLNTIKNKVYAR